MKTSSFLKAQTLIVGQCFTLPKYPGNVYRITGHRGDTLVSVQAEVISGPIREAILARGREAVVCVANNQNVILT